MTPRDLIGLALKQSNIVGEGQIASSETMNDAFSLLNMMMGQWNRKRWLIFQLVDVAVTSTGNPSFTVGPGQQLNVSRPDKLEGAYARFLGLGQPGQYDYPLDVLDSYEDYTSIPRKNQIGPPSLVFYDPAFPVGKLYVWPVPPVGQYEIHVLLKQTLAAFVTLNDQVALPNEYQEALLYNLSLRLIMNFGRPMRQDIQAMAKASLNTVRNANAAVPLLSLPDGLLAGRYNIYGDTYR